MQERRVMNKVVVVAAVGVRSRMARTVCVVRFAEADSTRNVRE